VIDPAGTRLYALAVDTASSSRSNGPWPVHLVEYDLLTESVRRTVDLPGIFGGAEITTFEPADDVYPFIRQFQPTIAISQDGKTLAIVNGDASSVVFLDAADLRVSHTVSSLDVAELPAATPISRETEATFDGGFVFDPDAVGAVVVVYPHFAPDGRLVISGVVSGTLAMFGPFPFQTIGPIVVDPSRGAVTHLVDLPNGIYLVPTQPAGDALYLWGIVLPPEFASGELPNTWVPQAIFVRLDAKSLEIHATRVLDGPDQLVVVAT
jgi:hypothetical protein